MWWVIVALTLLIIWYVWKNQKIDVSNRVVLFFRPSCPACQEFKPTWDALKQELHITFEDVNTEDAGAATKERQYGVEIMSVPSILIIVDGKVRKHEGPRDHDSLVAAFSVVK